MWHLWKALTENSAPELRLSHQNAALMIWLIGVAVLGRKSSCSTTELMTSEYLTARFNDVLLAGAMQKQRNLSLAMPVSCGGITQGNLTHSAAVQNV